MSEQCIFIPINDQVHVSDNKMMNIEDGNKIFSKWFLYRNVKFNINIKGTFAKRINFMIAKFERFIIIKSFYESDSIINVMRVFHQSKNIRNSLTSIGLFRNIKI